MKAHIYEHELCDPDLIGALIQVFDEFENVDGVYFPYGSIFRITGVEYDAPIQIPMIMLEDRYGHRTILTAHDLPQSRYRVIPEGKLTDVLYR